MNNINNLSLSNNLKSTIRIIQANLHTTLHLVQFSKGTCYFLPNRYFVIGPVYFMSTWNDASTWWIFLQGLRKFIVAVNILG